MAKSNKGPLIKTPKGTLSYPYLFQKDVGKEYSDGKFKTKLVMDPNEAAQLVSEINTYANKCNEKYVKGGKVPYKMDDEGNVVLTAKSGYRPVVKDCAGNVLADSEGVYVKTPPYGGSVCRLAVRLNDYGKGINAYLIVVKVLSLVTSEDVDFEDDDEGYVAPSVSETSVITERDTIEDDGDDDVDEGGESEDDDEEF